MLRVCTPNNGTIKNSNSAFVATECGKETNEKRKRHRDDFNENLSAIDGKEDGEKERVYEEDSGDETQEYVESDEGSSEKERESNKKEKLYQKSVLGKVRKLSGEVRKESCRNELSGFSSFERLVSTMIETFDKEKKKYDDLKEVEQLLINHYVVVENADRISKEYNNSEASVRNAYMQVCPSMEWWLSDFGVLKSYMMGKLAWVRSELSLRRHQFEWLSLLGKVSDGALLSSKDPLLSVGNVGYGNLSALQIRQMLSNDWIHSNIDAEVARDPTENDVISKTKYLANHRFLFQAKRLKIQDFISDYKLCERSSNLCGGVKICWVNVGEIKDEDFSSYTLLPSCRSI